MPSHGRETNDRVLVICGYLAVLAAASIVLTMKAPPADTTVMSLMTATRFVVAVAAAILGFITWFDRRFPVEGSLDPATRRAE